MSSALLLQTCKETTSLQYSIHLLYPSHLVRCSSVYFILEVPHAVVVPSTSRDEMCPGTRARVQCLAVRVRARLLLREAGWTHLCTSPLARNAVLVHKIVLAPNRPLCASVMTLPFHNVVHTHAACMWALPLDNPHLIAWIWAMNKRG